MTTRRALLAAALAAPTMLVTATAGPAPTTELDQVRAERDWLRRALAVATGYTEEEIEADGAMGSALRFRRQRGCSEVEQP